MIVTERDKKVLNFIEKFNVATTDTIQELFYPSIRVAQHRLKLMYDNKLLKRERDNFTSQYIYYVRKPKQLRHNLLLTDFYREMNRIVDIELFEKEFIIDNVRADGLIAYRYKNKGYIACIEVQIANEPLNVEKYEMLYFSGKYKKYFPVFPLIYAITNKKIPYTELKIIRVNEDMSNVKEVLK